jgi:hypothetical protein
VCVCVCGVCALCAVRRKRLDWYLLLDKNSWKIHERRIVNSPWGIILGFCEGRSMISRGGTLSVLSVPIIGVFSFLYALLLVLMPLPLLLPLLT